MFVNYLWCKGFGRNHRDNREFFPWTGSAPVMIKKNFPTRPPPNWPHQLQTPSCGPDKSQHIALFIVKMLLLAICFLFRFTWSCETADHGTVPTSNGPLEACVHIAGPAKK